MAEGQNTGARNYWLVNIFHFSIIHLYDIIRNSGRYEKHLRLLELKFTCQSGVLRTTTNEECSVELDRTDRHDLDYIRMLGVRRATDRQQDEHRGKSIQTANPHTLDSIKLFASPHIRLCQPSRSSNLECLGLFSQITKNSSLAQRLFYSSVSCLTQEYGAPWLSS
jgi:hypothetical protein